MINLENKINSHINNQILSNSNNNKKENQINNNKLDYSISNDNKSVYKPKINQAVTNLNSNQNIN